PPPPRVPPPPHPPPAPPGRPPGPLAEFGPAQARRIVGVLGPDTEAGERTLLAKLPDCECSAASSLCGDARCVGLVNGCNKKGGCGALWRYECNGRCG
ncbi:bacteriocin fulvocin C-related protein, partial [Nocardia brasiliensis]|uniref:bacteriocin fulvocin C-related protein n=1 Tax=Nocardia brasiliensis TaxID=37326 RepID=UPI0024556A2F